jgi:nucleoid-associated protein YgaU
MFQWGSFLSYKGVISQIAQNFTLFKTDGTPLRASVDVTFSETGEQQKKQNPTTRTEARKIWVVHEGQTLDWIAYQEYGDPACWRHIAETNNLPNPRDLRPGQVLKLTPLP